MPSRVLRSLDQVEGVVVDVLRDRSGFASTRGGNYESILGALTRRDPELAMGAKTLVAILDGLRRDGFVTGEHTNKTIRISATAEDILSGAFREDYRPARY